MNFKYFNIGALIPFILVLSLVLQPVSDGIENCLREYPYVENIAKFIDPLSTIGMLTIILTFMNFVAWKWRIFKWLIDIPNLNGRYQGKLTSSFIDPVTNTPVVKDCILEIKQTASKVTVFSYTGDFASGVASSRSYTTSEQLVKEDNGFYLLFYIFTNEPEGTSTQLNNHVGTAKFRYYPDVKTLDGDYYNGRGNKGTIKVKFVRKEILGRLIP